MADELRLEYSRALASLDPERIVGLLAPDVVIKVAVHDAPMEGREVAHFLFGVLAEELAGVTVTGEIVEQERAVVLFETAIDGLPAQGLNVVESRDGLITELTVFFRPLRSLERVAAVIGARMAERFGPPPA